MRQLNAQWARANDLVTLLPWVSGVDQPKRFGALKGVLAPLGFWTVYLRARHAKGAAGSHNESYVPSPFT